MIGLIGGTGIYDATLLNKKKELIVKTPFGLPSSKIITGVFEGKRIAFIARHGFKHSINPSKVNYRANIFALKKLGCNAIIGINAVGSLKLKLKPGLIVFPDQFIDRTYKREQTFYDKKQVCHINVSEPFCPEIRKTLINNARKLKIKFKEKATYICIEGPRFSTKAESALYRQWNADIIGMTLCPEAVLAREAEICYANIATITDYDNLKKGREVTVEEVLKTMKESNEKVRMLLTETIINLPEASKRKCNCMQALKNALI
jgi:5'-methylthioadenosine phosphorylase